MSSQWIGKRVRLSGEFLRCTGQFFETDEHRKCGEVIEATQLSETNYYLVVDDPVYGQWTAVASNVEQIPKTF